MSFFWPKNNAFLWTVELKNPTWNLSWKLKFCMDLFTLILSLCARFHTFYPKKSFSRKKTPKFVILVFWGIICQKSHTQNLSKAILSSLGIVFTKFQTYTVFYLKSAPPSKSAPSLFLLMFHFSKEIWTEILSKMMKLHTNKLFLKTFKKIYAMNISILS